MLEDQVFDVILEQATVKEKKVSYDELTKPQQEAAEDDKKSTAKAKKPAKKKAAAAKDKDSE